MSRIVSPTPIDIHIKFNEMTGACSFGISKPQPFHVLVAIFCQLLLQFINDGMAGAAQLAPTPKPSPKPEVNTVKNPFENAGKVEHGTT